MMKTEVELFRVLSRYVSLAERLSDCRRGYFCDSGPWLTWLGVAAPERMIQAQRLEDEDGNCSRRAANISNESQLRCTERPRL